MNTNSKKYQDHKVFEELNLYFDFYKNLSFSIMGFVSIGTNSFFNIDTYIFSSMQGTIESIRTLLKSGRINDSYALLRKYYDSVIINIYSTLYLQDNVSLDNLKVEKINKWLDGTEQLPEYRVMNEYVKKSDKLKEINELLFKDSTYKKLRNRCNDHVHYNFYHNLLLNDNELYLTQRLISLDELSTDLLNIFILHSAYLFYLNEHYMTASDYVDSLDCGLTPEEGSQYFVAPFIQIIFDKTIKSYRSDLAKVILNKTCMHLK